MAQRLAQGFRAGAQLGFDQVEQFSTIDTWRGHQFPHYRIQAACLVLFQFTLNCIEKQHGPGRVRAAGWRNQLSIFPGCLGPELLHGLPETLFTDATTAAQNFQAVVFGHAFNNPIFPFFACGAGRNMYQFVQQGAGGIFAD